MGKGRGKGIDRDGMEIWARVWRYWEWYRKHIDRDGNGDIGKGIERV